MRWGVAVFAVVLGCGPAAPGSAPVFELRRVVSGPCASCESLDFAEPQVSHGSLLVERAAAATIGEAAIDGLVVYEVPVERDSSATVWMVELDLDRRVGREIKTLISESDRPVYEDVLAIVVAGQLVASVSRGASADPLFLGEFSSQAQAEAVASLVAVGYEIGPAVQWEDIERVRDRLRASDPDLARAVERSEAEAEDSARHDALRREVRDRLRGPRPSE
jgi:hypothetical protein